MARFGIRIARQKARSMARAGRIPSKAQTVVKFQMVKAGVLRKAEKEGKVLSAVELDHKITKALSNMASEKFLKNRPSIKRQRN